MRLKSLKLSGFKSFAKSTALEFPEHISAVVGPNGSGKSNVAEAIAWVLGEQSLKNLRSKRGEDLIFNGSSSTPKMGKASVVLNFIDAKSGDELSISRTVFRDGVNEYSINEETRRLKDVVEALSRLGAGTLRHHIISQGEADRILNASLKERREMMDDALGLRIFHLKKEEGMRKLEKTEENIRQVHSLRHEIQPHLKFLKKQVDKVNELEVLKEKLKESSSFYFSKAEARFKKETNDVFLKKETPQKELKDLEIEIKIAKEQLGKSQEERVKRSKAQEKINELEREIGRLEGMFSREKSVKTIDEKKNVRKFLMNGEEMEKFMDFVLLKIEGAFSEENILKIKNILKEIKDEISSLASRTAPKLEPVEKENKKEEGLEVKYQALLAALKTAKEDEESLRRENEQALETERALYQKEIKLSEARNALQGLEARGREIVLRYDEIKKDREEIELFLKCKIILLEVESFDAHEMELERREIERLKIKTEESGGVGEEMVKEYEEIKSRDDFLSQELADLEKSSSSLKELVKELDEKLNIDFKEGVLKINQEFQNFFEVMFGGGKAELKTKEEGIDIIVSLPRKKVHSLNMLSGGERALTSIALLFAVSQVNPPPFLILDETDAALDESNSQKYAKMLKDLSKRTQLILITHNRATMSAADVLYGVTMGGDGISRILSVKLQEAEELVG